jgi:hypothetical protein
VNPQRPAVLLVVLGLLLGPGYYVYCEQLSGQEIGRYELRERAERGTLPDGTIQRFSGHLAFRPILLDLTPQHNDVRLHLTFHAAPDANAATSRYQATLFDSDHPVLQRDVEVALSAGESRSVTLGTFPIHTPNEHVFVLEEVGAPGAAVATVTVTAAQDVERLVGALAWTGVAMLLAGMGLLAYAAWGGRRT